jgi:CRISPR-associated endonuclease/helicase Cas3
MSECVSIRLLPQSEKLAPRNPFAATTSLLLYHQLRTYEALRNHALVINTHNTGAGKTLAALLYLVDAVPRGENTMLIAPTNELIRQHVHDVEAFAAKQELGVHVLRIDAPTLHGLSSPREHERNGERLNRLFQNPQEYGWDGRKPMVAVTNPDIFYYALYYSAYSPHDRRNLFQQFLTRFDYVIVDEFHYYSAKQLANFLFFFVICREWGYFASGRRVCLLSATPDMRVQQYLDRVFASDELAWIRPESEPAESADYPTTPVLTPLDLQVQAATLDEFTNSSVNVTQLRGWLDERREGALISNALWRINQARAALRGPGFDGRVGRITGAESAGSRQAASALPLILATPTVDLGYNFDRPGKTRQPMDFVVFDASSRDAFLQRLGRAGRVLGRPQVDVPSTAVALVSEQARTTLSTLSGRTIDRQALRSRVEEALPPRNDLYAYMRSYSVLETFWPIFQLERQMSPDMHDWIERLFESVLRAFAPDSSRWHFGSLRGKMRRFEMLGDVVRAKKYDCLGKFADEYVDWLRPAFERPDDAERTMQRLRKDQTARDSLLLPWAESQYYQTEAIFNFRDAYQAPMACVYDPDHLLADSNTTLYDALHVATNYEADYFADIEAFVHATGMSCDQADVYCRLRAHREKRLRIGLQMSLPRMSRAVFEALHCRRPTAMKDITLRAELPGEAPVPLDPNLRHAFEDRYVVLLIPKNQDRGRLMSLLRDRDIFTRSLDVVFADGSENRYFALVGPAALTVHAELEGYLWWREKTEDNAPVIA